jgi:hypothetical protein
MNATAALRLGLRLQKLSFAALALVSACGWAAEPDPILLALQKRSFLHGREYFVLRSGAAQLIVQADQVDLGPAFTWLVFDANENRQSARKESAFNFDPAQGFSASALEVVLGGFPFTALGHQTRTRWAAVEGIPGVEAIWWAGGVQVTEQLSSLGSGGLFRRRITVTSANLGGTEEITLRLALPPGSCAVQNGWLERPQPQCRLALGLASAHPAHPRAEQNALEIGPLALAPGQSVSVDTLLLAQIPMNSKEKRSPLPPLQIGSAPAPADGLVAWDISRVLEMARGPWTNTARLNTGDAVIQGIFDKSRFGLAGMVSDQGVIDAGIFEYGAQWVRDTSNTLLGLIHAGHFELARNGFAYVLEHMVTAEGNAMIGGVFDDPDREQFDQMGELLHALKAYRDWTGDDSLLRDYRAKLLALIERPLRPEFRGPNGLVHNRREFWERTLEDAYELAYQTYVILGLRDAAALAEPLGAADRAPHWLAEAERMEKAALQVPGGVLVDGGRLIKRRSVTGEHVRIIHFGAAAPDVPLKTERTNLAEPDATLALPIAFGLVPARSELALRTLDELEHLRDARWFGGGYERYHSSGQCDQPGPWTFATCFILRAQHEAGLFDRSRRSLEWLDQCAGGRTGAWFEETPLIRSQAPTAGILPWTSGEISLFVVRHYLGVHFEGRQLVLRPAPYPGSPAIAADLRFRQGRLSLHIPGPGRAVSARVNGRRVAARKDGAIVLPTEFDGGEVTFKMKRR